MKKHLRKLMLSALIVSLCANCVLPAYAAVSIPDREQQSLEDGVAASKKIFFQLYGQLWKEGKLDAKLADAVDRGFVEMMGLVLRSNVKEEAQEMVINLFNPDYEEFMRDLEMRFGDENNNEVAIFYENLADAAIEEAEDPKVKAQLRSSVKEILKREPKGLQSQIANSLRKKHKGSYIKTGMTEIGIVSPEFSRQMNSAIVQKLETSDMASALGSKFAMAAIPVAGAIVFSWETARDISSIWSIWIAPDEFKTQLKSVLSESFATQQPANYWELMEGDVRAIFEEASAVFHLNLDEAIDSASDPEVLALIEKKRAEEKE